MLFDKTFYNILFILVVFYVLLMGYTAFNNILVTCILYRSVLLVEETGIQGENPHRRRSLTNSII